MNTTVLVTGSGGIVGEGIIKSLRFNNYFDRESRQNQRYKKIIYKIISTDITPLSAGLWRSDNGYLVPHANTIDYVEKIIKIIKKNDISAVYVGSDVELIPLSEAKERIEKETNAKVFVDDIKTILICRDKWKTFEFLRDHGLQYTSSSLPEDKDEFIRKFGFPLVVKPREGYGSQHFYLVNNEFEMKSAISHIKNRGWNPIIQEYLAGEDEFTSGITTDIKGNSILSSISIKKFIKNGQTYKAIVDKFEIVTDISRQTSLELGVIGPLNIQSKLINNEIKIFEINPRFSATCPIRSVAGINEPDIIFRSHVLEETIKVQKIKNLVCMRYWNEVYTTLESINYLNKHKEIRNNDSFIVDYL